MNRRRLSMLKGIDNFAIDFQRTAKSQHFVRAVIHLGSSGIELLLGDLR